MSKKIILSLPPTWQRTTREEALAENDAFCDMVRESLVRQGHGDLAKTQADVRALLRLSKLITD